MDTTHLSPFDGCDGQQVFDWLSALSGPNVPNDGVCLSVPDEVDANTVSHDISLLHLTDDTPTTPSESTKPADVSVGNLHGAFVQLVVSDVYTHVWHTVYAPQPTLPSCGIPFPGAMTEFSTLIGPGVSPVQTWPYISSTSLSAMTTGVSDMAVWCVIVRLAGCQ